MTPVSLTNIQATAAANVSPDGAINVQVLFMATGPAEGQVVTVGSQGYYLQPDDAKTVAETPPTETEVALGLPLMDVLVARSLALLYQRGHFALSQLIPPAMLPATTAGGTQ